MRLSKIKLAGFKSFVDPTTFHLPSSLVGIVGPNGCGKSNVIDAVRWVMGEMSAKHLRGDSMADVIFNGSASRKPVGTASIELFFDNSDGSIGGQYAQYAEISLRRSISRDGTSSYFLNNTRCRRKDITEIFLGTGLGSRSYAIIEQGMVSRLVDAKPDEMRTYVEEAAGISKYKDRRRETETRIQHTRDNLARLNDLREEISKQLEYLQRQARTAERYKELKAKERRLEAELLATRLVDLDRSLDTARLDLSRRQTELEGVVAGQRRIEAEIAQARESHVTATEAFNSAQAQHYANQSEISRLEQSIVHARDLRDRQQADLTQVRDQSAAIVAELAVDQGRLTDIQNALAQLEPGLLRARQGEESAAAALRQAEKVLEDWQNEWHEYNLGLKELHRAAHVEQTRIEHLDAQRRQLERQRETLEQDLGSVALPELAARLDGQSRAVTDRETRAAELQGRLDALVQEADALRVQELRWGDEFEALTATLASCQGQVKAIRAVQDAALGGDDRSLGTWLADRSLDGNPRLAQKLRVDDHWVLAVETVLGDFLQAVTVDDDERHLDRIPDTQFTLVARGDGDGDGPGIDRRSLLAHVAEPGAVAGMLAQVLTAGDLAEAIAMRHRLEPYQSVVTADGIWLGRGWTRVNRGQRSQAGILAREQQLRELNAAIAEHQARIGAIEQARQGARQRISDMTRLRAELTIEFNAANREHAESLALLENLRTEITRAGDRRTALEQQRARIVADAAGLDTAHREAHQREARVAE
ncbi:MAG: chromosome segregation protein SMC, partial [Gammaproteobacteria bacterium]|nr:chromosome segregation protein SMC [Gammaproteobacteria bacterium]